MAVEMMSKAAGNKVLVNSVPAAAVTRGGRALFDITGRKGYVGVLY